MTFWVEFCLFICFFIHKSNEFLLSQFTKYNFLQKIFAKKKLFHLHEVPLKLHTFAKITAWTKSEYEGFFMCLFSYLGFIRRFSLFIASAFKFLYSARIMENADQRKLRIKTFSMQLVSLKNEQLCKKIVAVSIFLVNTSISTQ